MGLLNYLLKHNITVLVFDQIDPEIWHQILCEVLLHGILLNNLAGEHELRIKHSVLRSAVIINIVEKKIEGSMRCLIVFDMPPFAGIDDARMISKGKIRDPFVPL